MYVAVVLLGQDERDCCARSGSTCSHARGLVDVRARGGACGLLAVRWPRLSGAQVASAARKRHGQSVPRSLRCGRTVYVGACNYPNPGTTLYALKPDGSQLWVSQLPALGPTSGYSPAVDDDGTIYFAVNQGPLYAIEPDGTQKWAFSGHGCVASAPVVGPDGTIYVLGSEATVFDVQYLMLSTRTATSAGSMISARKRLLFPQWPPTARSTWAVRTRGFMPSTRMARSSGRTRPGRET